MSGPDRAAAPEDGAMQARWDRVDDYLTSLLFPDDPVLDAALRASEAAGLPAIQVSPAQGRFLSLIARAMGASRILEIGTLGGYSTIWLGRGLAPGGRLVTLELNPVHAAVAGSNLARAGLSGQVEVRVGPAAESLRRLAAEAGPPFDLVFIDADKPGYAEYLRLVLPLVRTGALIVADNVVRKGEVANPASDDPMVQGIRRFHEALAAEPRLAATALQTVGAKGYDGLAFAVVVATAGAA